MSKELSREAIGDSIHFNSVVDPKFKDNRIGVFFLLPLNLQSASDNAMVPLMLRKGSKSYPNMSAFNAKLNMLYGAVVDANVVRFNRYQQISLYIRFLDNRYTIENENLVEQCTALLLDLILSPNFDEDGMFFEKHLDLERRYLIDTIEGEINEKRSYAINRMLEIMCDGQPLSVPKYGTKETAENTTRQSVTNAWKNMLKTASIEVMFTGSGNPETAKQAFKTGLSTLERSPIKAVPQRISSLVVEEKNVTEEMENLQQGKLVMGFRLGELRNQREKDAARLFGTIYGGTPFSKLFLNVRERLSLCYYCAARVDTVNGILLVDSGVESENIEKAHEEILNQLRELSQGELSSEEIANTKMLIATSINAIGDSLGGLEGWYLDQILMGNIRSPQEFLEEIMLVTQKEIIAVAKGVVLDTVYLLSGKETAQ